MTTDGSATDPRAASADVAPEDRSLLIVDDDSAFSRSPCRAMERADTRFGRRPRWPKG